MFSVKKILLCIYSRNDNILRISETLSSMGYNVRLFYTDSFNESCSYWEKKLYKLGLKTLKIKYYKSRKEVLTQVIDEFCPDAILCVNTMQNIISGKELAKICSGIRVFTWLVDLAENSVEFIEFLRVSHKISTFEKSDIKYLRNNIGTSEIVYVPIGYNYCYKPVKDSEKKYDISFIGTMYKNRLKTLNYVAKYAIDRKWVVKICGPIYDKKYFWKRYILGMKYPYLMKVIENRNVISEETAKIYAASRICLNIHVEHAKGLNPRTFEIMATGSMQILDARDYYIDNLQPNEAFITYFTDKELVNNIEKYLFNAEERERIGAYARKCNKWTMEYCLREVLK